MEKKVSSTTKSVRSVSAAGGQGFHLLRRMPEHSAQPESAGEMSGITAISMYRITATRRSMNATVRLLPASSNVPVKVFTCEMRQPRAARASRLPVACVRLLGSGRASFNANEAGRGEAPREAFRQRADGLILRLQDRRPDKTQSRRHQASVCRMRCKHTLSGLHAFWTPLCATTNTTP